MNNSNKEYWGKFGMIKKRILSVGCENLKGAETQNVIICLSITGLRGQKYLTVL